MEVQFDHLGDAHVERLGGDHLDQLGSNVQQGCNRDPDHVSLLIHSLDSISSGIVHMKEMTIYAAYRAELRSFRKSEWSLSGPKMCSRLAKN